MSSAKVIFDAGKLRRLDRASVRALEKTAEALHTEIVQAQVIPFQQGHLQNDSTFVDISHSTKGHVDIVSSTPYARRLYYHPEYNFSHEENPNAQAHWFEPWADGGAKAEFAQKAFRTLYRREAGNDIS